MEQKRSIPYGVINWATLVHECHFVDNTGYIRKLESCRTPVYLRPKRFGKAEIDLDAGTALPGTDAAVDGEKRV